MLLRILIYICYIYIYMHIFIFLYIWKNMHSLDILCIYISEVK